jgi:small multidrug resistance pump
MSVGWWLLLVAIGAEVCATTALRAADGFSRLGPSIVVVVGYGLAFFMMSRALQTLPLGVAYAVWSGLGTMGAVFAGWYIYGERPTWLVVLGVALVIAGTVVLHAGASGVGAPARVTS